MNLDFRVEDAQATRAWGESLAQVLRAGDLVLLCGELGAGKTTLAQGIGAGLGVRGPISSPTFIVARHHRPLSGGVPMIHVDAYRIDGLADLETLDLDSTIDQAVTLVEWGEGKVENLSDNRLEIEVVRPLGGQAPTGADGIVDLAEMDDGKRQLILRSFGSRWEKVDWEAVFGKGAGDE